MPFKTFFNWAFDGDKNSPLPKAKLSPEGKVLVPAITHYTSPITQTYLISIFLKNAKLNKYLNENLNNMNLWYIEKEDLVKFIKRCIIDFKIQRKDIVFLGYRRQQRMFEVLRDKMSFLKNDDINLLCDLIDKSKEKDSFYESLGLEKPKKQKVTKKIIEKNKKVILSDFLSENFSTIDV